MRDESWDVTISKEGRITATNVKDSVMIAMVIPNISEVKNDN